MSGTGFGVVILAAGYSSRMGFFKPDIRLNGITLTQRLIRLYRQAGVDVFLVTGRQKPDLGASARDPEVKIIENPNFSEGMFSSVKCGLRAVQSLDSRAIFVQPVDIPLIGASTLESLLRAAERTDATIFFPCYQSRRGHPVVLAADLIPVILDWQGAGGLKGCLATRDQLAQNVEVDDRNILFDVDTPADLPELFERYHQLKLRENLPD